MRTGIIDSPLHPGKAPAWLFKRMTRLSGAISEAVIEEHGVNELLKRLANPFWFQALGCVVGFDWHSSGLTTTTCAALKVGLRNNNIKVCGGKGATSRKTPFELREDALDLGEERAEELVYASRMAAKSDNSCIQDGYQLYHHLFVHTSDEWVVIQQGMQASPSSRSLRSLSAGGYARRYHWHSALTKGFVEDTNNLICGKEESEVLDLTASQSKGVRKLSVDLINDGPEHLVKYFRMPEHHPVLKTDITKRDMKVLNQAYELQPHNYEELVSLRGFGPKKVRALALVCKLVYGAEASWRDPVKYSFAHGGKDGYPYPVNRRVYDNTILTLKEALERARVGDKERVNALKKLEALSEINSPQHSRTSSRALNVNAIEHPYAKP